MINLELKGRWNNTMVLNLKYAVYDSVFDDLNTFIVSTALLPGLSKQF